MEENEFYYRVQQGDNFENILKRFNASSENIKRNNEKIPLYAGEWIIIKPNDFILHITKPGQNLNDVAKLFGVEPSKIMQDNQLNSAVLFIGQPLKIYKEKSPKGL